MFQFCLSMSKKYPGNFFKLSKCSHVLDLYTKVRNNPLVIIFPWHGVPDQTVAAYSRLYESFGCDVIVTKSSLNLFLYPKYGLEVTKRFLVDVQNIMNGRRRPLFIHSASLGSYFYSLMLYNLRAHPRLFRNIVKSIRAQVLDSPIIGTLNEMTIGVSLITSSNAIIQTLIQATAKSYFFLTKPFTFHIYNELIDTFKYDPLIVPSLLMTSDEDPMVTLEVFDEYVDTWKSYGMKLTHRVWTDSEHVEHLEYHEEAYTVLLFDLLSSSLKNATSTLTLSSQESEV